MLQVRNGKIIGEDGKPVRLRGTCAGGWMNMENFITGYPGSESGLRRAFSEELGSEKGEHFFDRLLDHFLNESDVAFIRKCGANVLRLPVNYRHFESDLRPFEYIERGFERLSRAIGWCAKHGVYAIIDLHAVQGWQNSDWHSDNADFHSQFWKDKLSQDRFVALWEEMARRFAGNPAVAGYDVMNEPVTASLRGRFSGSYRPDWDMLNSVNRRVVSAIRAIDPQHIIFLEGDLYSGLFSGLEEPFAENLVYSSHNYTPAGLEAGAYPGEFHGEWWDRRKQAEVLEKSEGFRFARKHNVPLWVGEFGPSFVGPIAEEGYRLQSLSDQLEVFEEAGLHWTTWTYKDVGVMGWVQVSPQSPYMRLTTFLRTKKKELGVDAWLPWDKPSRERRAVEDLIVAARETIGEDSEESITHQQFLLKMAIAAHLGGLLQPSFARLFKGMGDNEIETVLGSFSLEQCEKRERLLEVLRPHLAKPD